MKLILAFLLPLAMLAQQGYHPDTRDQTRPAPGAKAGAQRLLSDLNDVQARTLSIMHRADFDGDYATALQAAWTARANAELIATLTGLLPAAGSLQAAFRPPLYLIAGKDEIRLAQAYWVEDGTLNYVTADGKRERMPLESLDRALTEQLNRERGVPFRLPER